MYIDLHTYIFLDVREWIYVGLFCVCFSYAKESYTATSDYDFYIILPDGEYDLVDFTRRAYKSLRDMKDRLPVDILINTVSGFNRRCLMPTMEREAFREGIVLYGA